MSEIELHDQAIEIHLANLDTLDGLGEPAVENLRIAVLAECGEENRRIWGASRDAFRRFAAMAAVMVAKREPVTEAKS